MDKELIRKKIIEFLQWNDRNGSYSDENAISEGLEPLTYEETLLFFWHILYADYNCYRHVENALDIEYEDACKILKQNNDPFNANKEFSLYDKSFGLINLLVMANEEDKKNIYSLIVNLVKVEEEA